MTEYQWRTCRRADLMLRWLLEPGEPVRTRWQGPMPTRTYRISKRKMQLFACAILWHLGASESIAECETQVDTALASDDLTPILETVFGPWVRQLDWTHPDVIETLRTRVGLFHGFEADLLRELMGTPHRPLVLTAEQRAWNDGTLATLADAIVRSRDFGQMPILGDALEDVGCTDEEALAHCREGGSHALGCWVLDACRGRS